tara:strand:+ start:465 stop:971 length:507 start_codon:yes stop_codon:yes gene_type:complete
VARLQRITTQFVDIEDRVKISALSQDNETLVLWLTQRLLIRIVDRCLTFVDENIGAKGANLPVSEASSNKQPNLQQISPSEEAVVATLNCRSLLIQEVDLRYYQDQLSIVFRHNKENQFSLHFDRQQLCQWLTIIFNIWRQAEWPMTIWPKTINFFKTSKTKFKMSLH